MCMICSHLAACNFSFFIHIFFSSVCIYLFWRVNYSIPIEFILASSFYSGKGNLWKLKCFDCSNNRYSVKKEWSVILLHLLFQITKNCSLFDEMHLHTKFQLYVNRWIVQCSYQSIDQTFEIEKKYIYNMKINWNYVAIAVPRSEGPCTRMCFECAPWTQCAYLRSILLCLQFTFGKWKWKYKHHSKLYFFNWNYESVDLHRIQFLLQNISNWFRSIRRFVTFERLNAVKWCFKQWSFIFFFKIIQLLFLCSTK